MAFARSFFWPQSIAGLCTLWLVTLLAKGALAATPTEVVPPARLDDAPIVYPRGGDGDATVVLELEIEKDGTVGNVSVTEGLPPFSEAARVAARAFRFSPALRNGLPVRARILAKLAFHPPEPPPAAAPIASAAATTPPKPGRGPT